MPSAIDLQEGQLIAGDYRIVRLLAEGGMGAVYVAEQVSTGRERALKVMRPQLVKDERNRERFAQEARLAARIESDHVVEMIGAGVDADTGIPWIAMELLKGDDLATWIERVNVMSVDETLDVLRQVCHALSAAHDLGLVHRDLKPENIFMSTARRENASFTAKVLDFGIAKMIQDNRTSATATGMVGSPMFMAPEQTAAGGAIRPSTDVWALGLIAFRLITGCFYWRAAYAEPFNLTALMREMLLDPLESASVRAKALSAPVDPPAWFDPWFAHCVVREPELRWRNAREAIDTLNRAARGESIPAAGEALPPLDPRDKTTARATDSQQGAPGRNPTPAPVSLASSETVQPLAATVLNNAVSTTSPAVSSTSPGSARTPRWVWPAVALGGACILGGSIIVAMKSSRESPRAQENETQPRNARGNDTPDARTESTARNSSNTTAHTTPEAEPRTASNTSAHTTTSAHSTTSTSSGSSPRTTSGTAPRTSTSTQTTHTTTASNTAPAVQVGPVAVDNPLSVLRNAPNTVAVVADVTRQLNEMAPRFPRTCGQAIAGTRVSLRVVMGSNGRVASVTSSGSAFTDIRKCVEYSVKQAVHVAPFRGAEVPVTWAHAFPAGGRNGGGGGGGGGRRGLIGR